MSLIVVNDFNFVVFPHSYAGECGAEVDSYCWVLHLI